MKHVLSLYTLNACRQLAQTVADQPVNDTGGLHDVVVVVVLVPDLPALIFRGTAQ